MRKIKTNKIKIYKNLYLKKKYIKNEIKKIVLKSILQNKSIKPIIRANAGYFLSKIKNRYNLSKQKNNICLKTGRFKGIFSKLNLSRHFSKKLLISNNLQNINVNSW
jgi:ribosomal protein S14